MGTTTDIRLDDLNRIEADVIDIDALKASGLIKRKMKRVKVMSAGEITKAVTLKGISVTGTARAAIEAAGGKIED